MEAEKPTKYYTYMLRCADGTLYSGYTTDPFRRAALHNSGKGAKYTRSRRPVELVFVEGHATKSEALRREAALKRLSRAQKLLLIEQTSIETE
ncbi:GIY-YIG nuclease family protein [Faecalispora anaeroviscerum]|uniref:GIY-YIG nuclease family protein n=1 Tax=Faecalispora anaeroviscerum TaxID=2991836 RepID=UPI0024BBC156|nr:GIY-YIG nuclease family protein [Faecalispora anaeroviscerum]